VAFADDVSPEEPATLELSLVQITLDSLITASRVDPGLAHQPRRAVRGEEPVPD
jgi:hypothetical protein